MYCDLSMLSSSDCFYMLHRVLSVTGFMMHSPLCVCTDLCMLLRMADLNCV